MSDNYINIEFRVKYKTQKGNELYIMGDSEDFGDWKSKKFKLDWGEGDIWKKVCKYRTDKKNNNNNLIYYKFIVSSPNLNDPSKYTWEKGPNRILDINNIYNFPKENNKYILDLKWETFTITFKFHHNLDTPDSCICILGSHPIIGEWKQNRIEEFKMEKIVEKNNKIDLWQKKIDFSFAHNNINEHQKEMDFEYKYLIYDYRNKKIEYEFGEFNRHIKILFTERDINEELKFMWLTIPKEFKLLTNSLLEIDDSYFIKQGKK